MNIIETRTVGSIILNKETPNRKLRLEHFLIPYYQRGYRWDEINIIALLDDIDNFINSKEDNYCLQPIVVVPNVDSEGDRIWEVIDGQQRLTTMFIIFKYLGKLSYQIKFGQRSLSTEFLENLDEEHYNNSQPDFHFMSEAYRIIKEWFEEKSMYDVSYKDNFYSQITRNVQVIWYQVEELGDVKANCEKEAVEDLKIDIFNRLNIGKIPLTDAELIRALLLSKIKLELSEREAIMRQSEISNEWDRIEKTLRQEDFWAFLTSSKKEKYSSHIEFVFRLIAGDETKKYSTYLWFEKQIKGETAEIERDNATQLWKKVLEYFAKFSYWYSNRTLYHHIGYLNTYNNNNTDDSILKKIILNSDVKKSMFKEWLIKEVKSTLRDIKLEELVYGNKNIQLQKLFLILNILEIEKNQGSSRFPFSQYRNAKGWSIEHIHAQNSEPMKDQKAIRKWIEDTLNAIENLSEIERENENNLRGEYGEQCLKDYIVELRNLSLNKDIDVLHFNTVRQGITLYFESESVHLLDNLALLSSSHNSALNNSIFPVKRSKIIKIDMKGEFIPPITRNVFLKYYSEGDLQPYYWSKKDKDNYFENLKGLLENYLN